MRLRQNSFRKYASRPVIISLLLAIVCLSSPATSAQTTQDEDEVLSVTTDLLLFPARIKDKQSNKRAALTEKDLSLKDDDRVTSGIYFSPIGSFECHHRSASLPGAYQGQAEQQTCGINGKRSVAER